MQAWLRLLIVAFIALALPLQGIAGVTLAHCGSSHERMVAAIDATPHRHADHGAAAAHHHHGDEVAQAKSRADHDSVRAQGAPSDPVSDLARYKCSSCAACCAGSAPPGAMPRLPLAQAAPAVFAEVPVSVDPFATGGPDRPPRTLLV